MTLSLLFLAAVATAGAGVYIFWKYGRDLPDYHELAHYEPPVTSRVYGSDGRLVAQYATQNRVFVPIADVPDLVRNAFLAAEDKDFYYHGGVDPVGIIRAAFIDLRNRLDGSHRRPIGASTITQQVAKNFFLNDRVSIVRKIKEAILSFRIERAFSKNRILELYLNQIYLGAGAYGVGAAALTYFNKGLDELTLPEAAFLGGLPKAPNGYDAYIHPKAAKARRDWVLGRMYADGMITRAQYEQAVATPLVLIKRPPTQMVSGADYFASDVRRELVARYGAKALYTGGLVVHSTINARLQRIARRVFRHGLDVYDRRHGWRGPVTRIAAGDGWQQRLDAVPRPAGVKPWVLAVVLRDQYRSVTIGLKGGDTGTIPWSEMSWARPCLPHQRVGYPPRRADQILHPGDVVLVKAMVKNKKGRRYPPRTYALRQIPNVQGALVAIAPQTGRVLAMVGGWSYKRSQFNRATQAMRQPGSAFKPFIYLTALEHGYTPSSLVLDAPIVLPQGPGLPLWRPHNYEDNYLGPATLQVGLELSRNLMTIRLAQALGMPTIAKTAKAFGIYQSLPNELSFALGAGATTVLKLTAAYAMLDNGGRKITPTLIDYIQNRFGKTIYTHDKRFCDGCWPEQFTSPDMPHLPDIRPRLADPVSDYQIIHMMEGVVLRGTGRVVSEVGKPMAGKTGTTNHERDAWFVGFSPNLALGVFVGFDQPRTLGPNETGGRVAAPIFRDFMEEALKGKPPVPFQMPPGVRMVRVDLKTGLPCSAKDPHAIWQAFRATDTLPTADEPVLRGQGIQADFSFTPLANDTVDHAVPVSPVLGGATLPDGSRLPQPPAATTPQAPQVERRMPVAGGVY